MSYWEDPLCNSTWFQRNVYFDDIFIFSLVLHEHKRTTRQGWFSVGTGPQCMGAAPIARASHRYPFPHVCPSQTLYTSSFDLEVYFQHRIGNGAYSKIFRGGGLAGVDSELLFQPAEYFNDTLEFRFPGSTPENLDDVIWDIPTLLKRRAAGLWPADQPLTLKASTQ